jgi:hypothetical protein
LRAALTALVRSHAGIPPPNLPASARPIPGRAAAGPLGREAVIEAADLRNPTLTDPASCGADPRASYNQKVWK